MNNQNGYTLMELVVAMAVTAIVFAILFGFYRQADKQYQGNLRFSSMNYEAIGLVKAVEENLMNAKGIVAVSEKEIRFKKQNGVVGAYRWDGQVFWYNGIRIGRQGMGLAEVGIKSDKDDVGRFDKNGDGVVSGNELVGFRVMGMEFLFVAKKDTVRYAILSRVRPCLGE